MTHTADPYDELASMFMTESSEPMRTPERPQDPVAVRAPLEILLLGHLPVRASLWMAPYADTVARRSGTVGLVRLDGEDPAIQVFHGSEDDDAAAWLREGRSLRETILCLGDTVRQWMVRPAFREDMSIFGRIAADRIMLLSGADQAAIVAAYRQIKAMTDAAPAAHLPSIGISILGTSETEAERAADRLNGTTTACLNVSVPLELSVPRMDAAVRSSGRRSFAGQDVPGLADVVTWINEARSRFRPSQGPSQGQSRTSAPPSVGLDERERLMLESASSSPTFSPPPPAPSFTPAPVPEPASPLDRPMSDDEARSYELLRQAFDAPTPAPVVPSAPANPPAPPAPVTPVMPAASPPAPPVSEPPDLVAFLSGAPMAPVERTPEHTPERAPERAPEPPPLPMPVDVPAAVKLAPKGRAEYEQKSGPAFEPSEHGHPVPLASHVPGLTPIVPRCPGHERIELALDAKGRLHLLGREDTLREMRVVDVWARTHRELLIMACPTLTIDPGARTIRHLFATEPLRLADLHGSAEHLHVLTPVEVDGKRGWYSAPLNQPPRG